MIKVMRNKYKNSIKKKIFIVCMIAIPLANFVVFTLYANFGGLVLSFMQFENMKEIFVGFANYKRFFDGMISYQYFKTILVSLGYFPVSAFISLPLSLVTAFFLYKKVPCAKLIIVFLYLPNIIPMALLAEFYRRMWDAGGGVVEAGLFTKLFAFVEGREINWLVTEKYANYALWIYTVWFSFGFRAILIWGAMSRVPQEMVESAELDGAKLFKEFTHITIPTIWPTLTMVIILTILVPFNMYMQPLLIADNGRAGTQTIALLAIQELKKPDPYFSSAISILTACVSLPLVLTAKWLLEKAFTVVEV